MREKVTQQAVLGIKKNGHQKKKEIKSICSAADDDRRK